MNSFLRSYATPLSLVTFLAAGVSGVMLFFDIGSHELSDLHEWLGIVFVVVLILHLVRNWRGALAMLSAARIKTIVLGLGAVAVVLIAIYGFGGERGQGFGGPRLIMTRLASAPIAKMAPALGLTSDQAIARLKGAGIAVQGPQQSLAEVANKQNQELPKLLNLVLAEPEEAD